MKIIANLVGDGRHLKVEAFDVWQFGDEPAEQIGTQIGNVRQIQFL